MTDVEAKQVRLLINDAVSMEREACAKLAEEELSALRRFKHYHGKSKQADGVPAKEDAIRDLAAKIRSRK